MKKPQRYKISYAPPATVKDDAVRNFDTSEEWRGEAIVNAQNYGSVWDAGDVMEIVSTDLVPLTVGT